MKATALLFLCACTAHALPPVEEISNAEVVAAIERWQQVPGNSSGITSMTFSMWPYLRGMEVVLIERRTWNTPVYRGDLVDFDRGDRPHVLHEVIEVRSGWFLTKGLNCEQDDGWRPVSKIHGIARRVLRDK